MTPTSKTAHKPELRKAMRKMRRQLPAELRARYNVALNQALFQRLSELKPCFLAAYLAFDGEPDLAASISSLRQAGFRIALPYIEKQEQSSRMAFRLWQAAGELADNDFGISEPRQGELVLPEDLGVVLMPLVAWDASGGRLGMGAGYYDRAFAGLGHQDRPLRIGIAYHDQKTGQVPMEPHDVRLHELITEQGRFTFPA